MFSRSLRTLGRRNLSYAQLQSLKGKNISLDIHPEVEEALAHQKPVVALETALVSHGLPFPQSLDVPLALEEIVRENGAIPATIGIIRGRVKVGLTRAEVERLADGETRKNARKISRRDIGAAIATGVDGGWYLSLWSLRSRSQCTVDAFHRNYMCCNACLCCFGWYQGMSVVSYP
jgi:pseudouridine-5'-phosphate glycosidase/pseudouridine kinase